MWATITPPNYSSLPINPTTGIAYESLPTVKLSKVADGSYKGKFDGFVKQGVYEIIFYAEDNGNVSKPVKTTVEIQNNKSVNVALDIPPTVKQGTEFKVSRTVKGEGEYDEYEAVFLPDGNYFVIADQNIILDSTRVEPFARRRTTLSPEGNTILMVSLPSSITKDIPIGTYQWYSVFTVPGGNPLNSENWLGHDVKEFEVFE